MKSFTWHSFWKIGVMNETYPGKSFIDKIAQFIFKLELIEDEYWWWFCSRHGNRRNQDCDMLTNHVEIDFIDFDHLIFSFLEPSELPFSIKSKCVSAYFDVFKKQYMPD